MLWLFPVSPQQEREIVFLPPPLEEESLPGDLLAVLFKCEAHDSPWRALLAHAIALQRPLLAILAACYKVCTCMSCIKYYVDVIQGSAQTDLSSGGYQGARQ